MAVKKRGGCVEDLHVLSETGKGGEDSRVLAALMGPRKRRETRRPTIFFFKFFDSCATIWWSLFSAVDNNIIQRRRPYVGKRSGGRAVIIIFMYSYGVTMRQLELNPVFPPRFDLPNTAGRVSSLCDGKREEETGERVVIKWPIERHQKESFRLVYTTKSGATGCLEIRSSSGFFISLPHFSFFFSFAASFYLITYQYSQLVNQMSRPWILDFARTVPFLAEQSFTKIGPSIRIDRHSLLRDMPLYV